MSGNSTVYDVRVRYALDDRASRGAQGIASACDKAAGSAFSLKGALVAVGGIAALHKAKSLLIDFNSEIDQMKIGLSTVMQMQLHIPFAKANKEADKLFDTFQQMAKKSPATTKDFMEMANSIAPGVALAGGGPDKLAKLTQGAVTASIALGERADVVALDIKQMLAGTVGLKDRTAMQLLGGAGVDHLDFNKKSGSERAKLVESMLSQEALQHAADQFGDSFKGQISTIQDQLEIALGQVGKPLMASITDEVRKMNGWIEKHPKMINEYVTKFGTMIKEAFSFVKSVAGWLVDNRDMLMDIGKVFLVFKGAQMGSNLIKSFKDNLGTMVASIKNAGSSFSSFFSGSGPTGVMGMVGRLGALGSAVGTAVPYLYAFGTALSLATTLLSGHNEEDKKARNAQISLHEAVEDYPELQKRQKDLTDILAGKGPSGAIAQDPTMRGRFQNELNQLNSKVWDPEKIGMTLKKISDESKAHGGSDYSMLNQEQMQHMDRFMPSMFDSRDAAKSAEITNEVMSFFKTFQGITQEARDEALKYAFPEQFGAPNKKDMAAVDSGWKPGSNADINVTIQKIEVASEDPDRFVFGIAKLSENAAKHPTASQHTMVGGF
jgi:phage host-nuclease inhibitor protein Gam